MAAGNRLGRWVFFGVIPGIALVVGAAVLMPLLGRGEAGRKGVATVAENGEVHPVVIREPRGDSMIDSGKKDANGRPVMVSCATCHDTRVPDAKANDGAKLDEFHVGLRYKHGALACLSCHNAGDYNSLKLASGERLEFKDSIRLCAQCHGPQYRDYQNGSHGGMNGHWDLKTGPRERNHCTNCHDAHQPRYPLVLPVFPPKPVAGESVNHASGH